MTFKWPNAPSPPWTANKLADYGELRAWQNSIVSLTELGRLMNGLAENDYGRAAGQNDAEGDVGGVPEEDESDRQAEAAFDEMDRRAKACNGGYPFALDNEGYTLTALRDDVSQKWLIYRYLLLVTRLNMNNNYQHGGIDGRRLFEKLSASVAREYLGCRADGFVFGTGGAGTGFRSNVDELCKRMGEGGRFVDRDDVGAGPRDDKLDVVAWKGFADGRGGQLILFGQCKTGTSYEDQYTELQPEAFCESWLEVPPVVLPVRMFFVADAVLERGWRHKGRKAGLLFDRCRIVEYAGVGSGELLGEIAVWSCAAAGATGLIEAEKWAGGRWER